MRIILTPLGITMIFTAEESVFLRNLYFYKTKYSAARGGIKEYLGRCKEYIYEHMSLSNDPKYKTAFDNTKEAIRLSELLSQDYLLDNQSIEKLNTLLANLQIFFYTITPNIELNFITRFTHESCEFLAQHLPRLSVLTITSGGLQTMPTNTACLTSLTKLNIRDNPLKITPELMETLPKFLQILCISENQIDTALMPMPVFLLKGGVIEMAKVDGTTILLTANNCFPYFKQENAMEPSTNLLPQPA